MSVRFSHFQLAELCEIFHLDPKSTHTFQTTLENVLNIIVLASSMTSSKIFWIQRELLSLSDNRF